MGNLNLLRFSDKELQDELNLRSTAPINDKFLEEECAKRGHDFNAFWARVYLKHSDPEFWEMFHTSPMARDYGMFGSRIISGNGAIDGSLKPEYKEILPRVNAKRALVGATPIR